ncbi:MAG: hypothetical protein JW955_05405 [Sedimentisphaerales bacterium]|nr:hypothetical protein [Sedimentisphaerales bacterium]
MTPSDIFGIVVRTIGLIMTLVGLWTIGFALLILVGGGPGGAAGLLIAGIPESLVGLWLLRGAKPLVQFAFPEEH